MCSGEQYSSSCRKICGKIQFISGNLKCIVCSYSLCVFPEQRPQRIIIKSCEFVTLLLAIYKTVLAAAWFL